MLLKWKDFVNATDPDITGYNIANFDIPYLLNEPRLWRKLCCSEEVRRSPLKGIKAQMKDTVFSSSAYGKRENVETTINGRVVFDVLPYMFRNRKLSSCSLNNVSSEF